MRVCVRPVGAASAPARVKDLSLYQPYESDAPQTENKAPGPPHIAAVDPITTAVPVDEEKY